MFHRFNILKMLDDLRRRFYAIFSFSVNAFVWNAGNRINRPSSNYEALKWALQLDNTNGGWTISAGKLKQKGKPRWLIN